MATLAGASLASAKDVKRWTKVDVPLRETLFDISFDKDKLSTVGLLVQREHF